MAVMVLAMTGISPSGVSSDQLEFVRTWTINTNV